MATDALPNQWDSKLLLAIIFIYLLRRTVKRKLINLFKALSEGGKIEMKMADQFWGDYFGSLSDKFGVRWMINYAQPKQ